jgi:hypothetical protein
MSLQYLYHLNINDSLQHTLHSVSYVILLQVLEIVNQAHDVPFGSSFEVHARWLLETSSATSCTLVVKVGVHFKRWCVMQSKIRAGTLNEYTADVEMAVKLAKRLLTNSRVNLQKGDENP